MDNNIFDKVLDEIKGYKTPLRFIRWGEPTLHPKMISWIRTARANGVICHINTNGYKIDDEMIAAFIDIPLDSIKFSFQGVDAKSYREMRNKDFFEGLLSVVMKLYEKRNNQPYPFIHISTTITYETGDQVEMFKNLTSRFTDRVSVGRTILEHMDVNTGKLSDEERERLRCLKDQESVIKDYVECPEVFDKLSINWDGTVSACCKDYDNFMVIGDIRENSIKEIWRSEKMNEYRHMLAEMRHSELDLCKTCYDYMSLSTPGLQKI